MNKQRLVILILAGLGVLATFLPWVKYSIWGSVSGIRFDGPFTFALFLVPLIISLLKDKTKPLTGDLLYGAIIPSIIAGVIGIWNIIHFNSTAFNMGDNPFAQVEVGGGVYLVVLVGIALPIAAFLLKNMEQQKKRPTVITIICILGFIEAAFSIPMIFWDIAGQIGNWYPLYLGFSCIISFVCMVGLWLMKKWAAFTYAGFVVFNQIVLMTMVVWNIMALIIPAIVVGISLAYLKKMD